MKNGKEMKVQEPERERRETHNRKGERKGEGKKGEEGRGVGRGDTHQNWRNE